MSEAPAPPPRPTSTRSKARKRALDILFEAELRGADPLQTLAERTADAAPPVRDYTATLVQGVHAHAAAIDERISGAPQARLDPTADCPGSTAPRCGSPSSSSTTPTSPMPWSCPRRCTWSPSCRPTSSPSFVNGVLGGLVAPGRPDVHTATSGGTTPPTTGALAQRHRPHGRHRLIREVDRAGEVAAGEGEHAIGTTQPGDGRGHAGSQRPPCGQRGPVVGQHRVRLLLLPPPCSLPPRHRLGSQAVPAVKPNGGSSPDHGSAPGSRPGRGSDHRPLPDRVLRCARPAGPRPPTGRALALVQVAHEPGRASSRSSMARARRCRGPRRPPGTAMAAAAARRSTPGRNGSRAGSRRRLEASRSGGAPTEAKAAGCRRWSAAQPGLQRALQEVEVEGRVHVRAHVAGQPPAPFTTTSPISKTTSQ